MVKALIKNGESKTLEFKENISDSIINSVVAFANTSGGKILIGVSDDGSIKGIDENEIFKIKDSLSQSIFDSVTPKIIPEIYTINIDNKLILVIEIYPSSLKPYFISSKGLENGVYIRVGATNRVADKPIIAELEREKSNISFDEEINFDYSFNALDLSPLKGQFSKLNKSIDDEKLKNLKLIRSYQNQLYPTNALIILLGKFDNCKVKCSRFKGITMDEFIDRKEYGGDIFTIFENSLNFILNHINLSSKIESIVREDRYEIPLVALREALINALIHRDYTNLGRDIKVGIYDDMVNIVSPGGYPSFITQDDVDSGRSEARNRVVANVFKELGLIEQWGSGIKRIKSSCKKAGLKEPVIAEKNDFVDVEIYRQNAKNSTNIDSSRTITNDYERFANDYSLVKDEKDIIKFIIDNGKITRKETSKVLNIKDTKAYELLNSLAQKGYLKRNGLGRGTYYSINFNTLSI